MSMALSIPSRPHEALRRSGTAIRHAPLLAGALFWVATVRIGLTFASHRCLRRVFLRRAPVARPAPPDPADGRSRRVAWAVRHAARLVPRATCLTQALAAQIMLARRAVPSTLHLGVTDRGGGEFAAHAWLEAGGHVLIGGSQRQLSAFRRIAAYGTTEP